MKRHQKKNKNTPEWWSEYSSQSQANVENQPIPQVGMLLSALSQGADKVLDVGCWRGGYFRYFPENTIVHGVDICEEAIEIARKARPTADVIKHDVKDGLPYPDDAFDLVYFGEILEHVEDPQALCDEVLRVLKPGGVAVANTPFEDSIPCDVHLWFFDIQDLKDMFGKFKLPLFYRFSCSAKYKWEHFLVIARKP